MYDDALRASGLRITQFTLLFALEITGEVTQGALAEVLAMDSTTLTRGLAPLLRRKLIVERPGADRRERLVKLTPAGQRKTKQSKPRWARAQKKLAAKLGTAKLARLRSLLDLLA
jgi:DNA-binding MarR family transcriptional regulator